MGAFGLHAGDPLILFESPFSRIIGPHLPFEGFMPSILWSMGIELAIIAALWWRYREKASPFLVAGVFVVLQMLGMGLLHRNPLLEAMLTVLGAMPSAAVVGLGLAIGAATSWAGWQAGKPAGSGGRVAVAG